MARKRHEMTDHESALPTSAPDSVTETFDDGMREALIQYWQDGMDAIFAQYFGELVTAQAPQPPLRSRDTETKQNV